MNYTHDYPSSDLFRKWAGISCLAGVMERKVWVQVTNSPLYPNMYILLVGPPAAGKTVLTDTVGTLWRGITDLHIAPTSITDAAIIDALSEASRKIIIGNATGFLDFNSLLIASNEFSVFLPAYDGGMMSILTDVYDCKMFDQRRRGGKLRIIIPRPQLHFIAGTTPSYLNEFLPQGAWDQGFISRTIIVYSGEKIIKPLFAFENTGNNTLWQDVIADLKLIANINGKMGFAPDAAAALSRWHMSGGDPAPEHPKLAHYNSRRTAHLIKLCMVASISRSNELVIRLEDYQRAMDWLVEVELYMPDIFKAMGGSGESRVMEDAWHYIYSAYAKEKQPISEHRVIHFLQQKVPSHAVFQVLTLMVKSNMLEVAGHDQVGRAFYKPSPKVSRI